MRSLPADVPEVLNSNSGSLHRAAGPGLAEEGRRYAPIRPGEAVVTAGYDLPNPYVIHCLGPVFGVDEPADELLASCYREALRLAEEEALPDRMCGNRP